MNEYKYPPVFEDIIDIFKGFPGVGRRSAERMALSLLQWQPQKVKALGELLSDFREKVTSCPDCGNLSSNGELCAICRSPNRDQTIICIVEDASQIVNIEKSGLYKGTYHVLGGKLSPLTGRNAEDLSIETLQAKVKERDVQELIFALSQDVEGQATVMYISDLMQDFDLKITRLAQGLPAGSDISYADSATIAAAMNGRVSL